MSTMKSSLRLLVEKWLGPMSAMTVRVTQFGRIGSNQRRFVCVEAPRPAGKLVIYFFLHDNGVWCVFPPDVKRPVVSFYRSEVEVRSLAL